MRLIDADALMETYADRMSVVADRYSPDSSECGILCGAMKLLSIQPTIEPERKKGRWIKKTIKKKIENDYSCSECGRHVSVMRGYDVRLVYPFCHCGAEMEGWTE